MTSLLVQVETVHLQKEDNLSQSNTVTGQEPDVRHIDMMSEREEGGVEEEEASEREEADAANKDWVNVVGRDEVCAVNQEEENECRKK